jgi:hypothetical protein
VSESDDKNNLAQKTVTIYAATGEETYEPVRPTVEVKRLQTKLDSGVTNRGNVWFIRILVVKLVQIPNSILLLICIGDH